MSKRSGVADVYRNLTRRLWSVREGGRVVRHVPAIALVGVVLRASEASRLRCVRTGSRDVHAWARGVPCGGLSRPAAALRLRYRLDRPGFRDPDEAIVTAATAAWFEADGTAWFLAAPDETLAPGGFDMRSGTQTISSFDLAHLSTAGVLDDWAFKRGSRRGDYVLVGTDAQGRERETGNVQAYDLAQGWAWVSGTGLLRLGAARSAIPSMGVTL